MSTKEKFYEVADGLFKNIRETQNDNIFKGAQLMCNAIKNDGVIFLFDTGHIIDAEILNRAGGFELMRRFRYNLEVIGASRSGRDYSKKDTSMEGLAKLALKKAEILPGDVMVIGSVSGKTVNVIDLALACKEMGVKTIAVTSVTYSSQLESEHPSKKRLFEICDVVIDNCAPYADAMLEVEGLDSTFIPASGISAAYLMWALNADLADLLLESNIQPGILRSVNYPPNREYNKVLGEHYQKNNF